jgi:hypothetical protein
MRDMKYLFHFVYSVGVQSNYTQLITNYLQPKNQNYAERLLVAPPWEYNTSNISVNQYKKSLDQRVDPSLIGFRSFFVPVSLPKQEGGRYLLGNKLASFLHFFLAYVWDAWDGR